MGSGPAHLMAAHFASLGNWRLGFGVILQQSRGMRPGELLGIRPEDITLPDESLSLSKDPYAVITLGARVGTKCKRAQSCIVRHSEFPWILKHLLELKHCSENILIPIQI